MNALQRFQSFPMMQLNCCLLLLLLTLQCQNGQVTRARPDIKLTACNTSENAKNRNSKCICNETVVDCTKTFHRMQSVPDKILYTIKKLYLNGNAINKIKEKDFIEFDRLEQLFLQDNTISVIHPRAFASLFRLEILNLSNNRIQALDPSGQTFQHLSGLRELHLQNNQITQINKYSFLTLTAPSKIVTVHLGGNPVQCDCDVQALRSWTRSLTVGTVQIRNLTCANDHMKPYEDVDEALFKQCAHKSWSDDNREHTDNNTITAKDSHERQSVRQAVGLDENIENNNNKTTTDMKTRLPTKVQIKNTNLNQDNKEQNVPNQTLKSSYNNIVMSVYSNLTVDDNGISLIRKEHVIKYGRREPGNTMLKTIVVNSGIQVKNENIVWFGRNQQRMYLNVIRKGSERWTQLSNVERKYNKYATQGTIKSNNYNTYQGENLQIINGREVSNKENTNHHASGRLRNKMRQRNIRDTGKQAVKRQITEANKASENNPVDMSDSGSKKQGDTASNAGQGQMFGGIITCPTCSNERTNHGCNLNGARQCYGEQMACHKILEWDSGLHEMKITSKCDNYTSCMAEEAQNQQQCGVSYRESDIKLCHFCCYGPTCTTESIGGRTKDYTFDLSYIRDNAVYEPHMADIGHPRYLQEEERIDKGIRLAVTGISGGIDVYLVQFEPQPNDQYKVVLKLRVTTFSFMPDSIEDDIRNSILLSLSQQGSFFSGENIVPESLSLTADTQDSSPCPEDVSFSTDKGTITWHASPEGSVFMLCPYANVQNPGTSNAVRTCSRKPDGSVAWTEADYSSCPSMSDQEPVTLDKLFETSITTSNAKAVSAMLKTYMESAENLTGETADNVVNKLEMLLHDSMLQQRDVVNNVVECLSNLINSARTSDAFEQRNDISKRLLNIIDHISDKTPLVNGTLMLVTSNLAIAAQGVNASETLDVALTVDTDSTDGLLNNSKISVGLASRNTSRFTGSTSIVIPTRALVASMTPEERLDLSRISFVVHQTDTLFAATENNGLDGELQTNGTGNDYCLQNNSVSCQKENTRKFMTKINSQVVSANVPEVTVAGLKENITMNFIHNANATNPRCVFWNTNSSSGVAHWSGEGCGVVTSGSGETTCGCNHLTNFALIMDVYQEGGNLSELDRKILSIISYVGCGISLIALIFTLLTYSCFRKLRSDNPSKILINLCLALMLSNLVYLVGMHDYTFDNTASCKTVAILLHYFLLSSLTWMAVEAFYMYLALILVFKTYFTNFILKCCLVGWGIPLVIVIITLGVNSTDNYGIINSGLCWLRNPAFYAAFVGPVCFILLMNCLAVGLVMRQLVGISSSNLSKTDRNNTIQRLRGAVGIVVLLGLSWVFAIFAIGQASIAFYYMFAVCNSMQGLFIFIFYCLLKKDAVISWKRSLPCFEEYGETSKTSSNSRVMTSIAATHRTAKYNSHSRSGSSTFQRKANSVTSTLIDSQNNSCFSNSCSNNPYDSNDDYDIALKTETAAASKEYKQRISPLLASEGKNNPESKSQNVSSYRPPDISSQSNNCDNTAEVADREKVNINSTSKSLYSNLSQFQPVLSSDADCSTSTSSQGSHLQRSLNVAVDSSDAVGVDSLQLEFPDNDWSNPCYNDSDRCTTTSLSRSEGETDCSSEKEVMENRPNFKYVTHL